MNNKAFEAACVAYAARKEAERQARWQQLRHELVVTPSAPAPSRRTASSPAFQRARG